MGNTLHSHKYYFAFSIFIVFIILLRQPVIATVKNELSVVPVTIANYHTTIWISDFPKQATVLLFDDVDNLPGFITINKHSAAYRLL